MPKEGGKSHSFPSTTEQETVEIFFLHCLHTKFLLYQEPIREYYDNFVNLPLVSTHVPAILPIVLGSQPNQPSPMIIVWRR